jgi:hypothetical protein
MYAGDPRAQTPVYSGTIHVLPPLGWPTGQPVVQEWRPQSEENAEENFAAAESDEEWGSQQGFQERRAQ